MSKRIEKEIEFYRDVFKTVVFLMAATAGGTASLLLKVHDSPMAVVLAIAGLLLEPLWIGWAIFTYVRIKKLLEEL